MKLKHIILFFALLAGSAGARAQMLKDNSKISCEARKKSGNTYELIVHVKLEKGWHVYSMKPGGDGSLIPAEVSFKTSPKVQLKGSVKEKGKLITEAVDGVDGKINMYSDKIDYIQEAVVNGATEITGTYNYQVCNNMMCLPPASKEFRIVIKS